MPRGGGGYSGFQVSGMIVGFLGVSNFRFRDSFGYENLAIEYFFGWLDLSRNVFGYSKQSEDLW